MSDGSSSAQVATPDSPAVAVATLAVVTGASGQTDTPISVHFNPVSLQLQVSNELKNTGNDERKQYIAKTSAKLTMELIFDTTDTGEDVTAMTAKLQAFVAPPSPPGAAKGAQKPPPQVIFEWGTLRFKGIAEGYKETLDFFSASGVPLRSSVNLTLSRQDKVFDEPAPVAAQHANDSARDALSGSAADLAKAASAPGAARDVAAANGQENLRFGTGASLTVGASVTLRPPSAFASGGGGISASLGLSLGGNASAGGGLGLSVGVNASAGISGLSQLSATEGAFAGLSVSLPRSSASRLDPSKLIPNVGSAKLSTDAGATFQVGGKARLDGPSGLRADVGASSKLAFD